MATAKRKTVAKKPAAKKPVRKVAPQRLYFRVDHNTGNSDYLIAVDAKGAGEIEKRLAHLQAAKKIRSFERYATMTNHFYARIVPEQISIS